MFRTFVLVVRNTNNSPKMSDEEAKRATDIGTKMGECMPSAMSPP